MACGAAFEVKSSMQQVETRILVISDTHSALPNLKRFPDYAFSHPFPQADIAIHCGDLTSTGKLAEHERALKLLKALPAPIKVVIPGNHDLTLDKHFCATHEDWEFKGHLESRDDIDDAHQLYTNASAKQAGIVYLTEGSCSLRLENGASLKIYASAYTPEFYDWAFPYPRNVDRYTTRNGNMPGNPVPEYSETDDSVSIMITHGPPKGILDLTSRNEHVGCDHLMTAVERCRPKLHVFGHIHEGWGSIRRRWSGMLTGHDLPESLEAEESTDLKSSSQLDDLSHVGFVDGTTLKKGEETIFVNASIMSYRYRPDQKPWIIDLMLPSYTDQVENKE